MDVVINGDVSEESTDKEKGKNSSADENCDTAASSLKDDQHISKTLSDGDHSPSRETADDLPHNTSDKEKVPQSESSSDALPKQIVPSDEARSSPSRKNSQSDSSDTAADKCSKSESLNDSHESEEKLSEIPTDDDSLSTSEKKSEVCNGTECSDQLQPSDSPDSSEKVETSTNIESDTCQKSENSDKSEKKCIDNENSLPPFTENQPSKDIGSSKESSSCTANTNSDEKLTEKMDVTECSSVTNSNSSTDKELKEASISEETKNSMDNSNCNPLEQLNEHLKSIGSSDSEIINSSTPETDAQNAGTSKNESCKTCSKDDRHKESDSFVFTEISKEETGFPDVFTGLVVIGKYISVKGDFTLRSSEALVESPSLIAPYLLKEPDSFPPRPNDSKLEQKDFFRSAAGEMLIGIGLSRVSEWYHRDMSRIKKRVMKKEGKNPKLEEDLKLHESFYNESKKANKIYNFPLKACDKCGFATESEIVMEGHLLVPHVNLRREYQCNFCDAINRDPKGMLEHMYRIHGKTGRIQPPVLFFECPYCTFESNSKVKLGNHLPKCQRFYDPNRNQAPPKDFEFPALTPKPITVAVVKAYEKSLSSMQRGRGRPKKIDSIAEQLSMNQYASSPMNHSPLIPGHIPPYRPTSTPTLAENLSNLPNQMMPPLQMPNMNLRPPPHSSLGQIRPPGLPPPMHLSAATNRFYQVVNSSAQLMPMLGNSTLVNSPSQFPYSSGLVNANSISKKTPTSTPNFLNSFFSGALRQNPPKNVPEVTITPLPKLHGPYPVPLGKTPSTAPLNTTSSSSSSSSSSHSNNLVVCEICDGYIKDLEQLRSHMQLIHKVKIHPKMLVSRPPLNCQKCQWRFFTDQGLERHLLGSHGLVTSNMQELANKNKDAGCCTICGRVYASKLVSHMNQVHKLTLKPAHLSYKCTVCSATFNLYRLFENHVYLVHSGAAKRPSDGSSNPSKKLKTPCGDNNGELHADREQKNHTDKKLMEDSLAKCTDCGVDFRKNAAQMDKCEKCLKCDVSQGTLKSKMS